jgi:hypothetical protein
LGYGAYLKMTAPTQRMIDKSLPPLFRPWTDEDFEYLGLSDSDLQRIYIQLKKRTQEVRDRIEQEMMISVKQGQRQRQRQQKIQQQKQHKN